MRFDPSRICFQRRTSRSDRYLGSVAPSGSSKSLCHSISFCPGPFTLCDAPRDIDRRRNRSTRPRGRSIPFHLRSRRKHRRQPDGESARAVRDDGLAGGGATTDGSTASATSGRWHREPPARGAAPGAEPPAAAPLPPCHTGWWRQQSISRGWSIVFPTPCGRCR